MIEADVGEVYLDSLSFALGGCRTNLDESVAADRLVSSAEDLRYAGFEWHHRCSDDESPYDLAGKAVAPIAAAGQLAGTAAIVYATCLPLNANVGATADWERTRDVKYLMDFPGSRLQSDYELDDAVVLGLGQQACTSMLGSVRLAAALLRAEPDWDRVLCVSSDRFPPGARYEQAYNLISDGAAACVVSRVPSGFRYLAAHQITNGGLATAGDDETVGTYFSYTRRLVAETLDRAGMHAADLDWVVTQNTNERAWRILARLLNIDADRIWSPSIAEVGHVISADNVINLVALNESGKLASGQRIALVMAGFGLNWQCLILEVC
ncbi:3-oxoacyl-[acyl-carrier-protein] synthase III C-terminal domain-containing protein [Nocardia stercoris]|uniref:3-oxoacyl-ACP synthase n=1 Tax=Nocardia stercoris TaxID=2483361 RepID=A0A3M2L0W5_9NOCA|nr:3-oxoacyl-[acyl-carrier-protein] synthase III C-terminal domain-containing protein [Nocardia stercoris]RMI29445.1 hypothetical protein EBN03_25515 [Nocardia stercoris]